MRGHRSRLIGWLLAAMLAVVTGRAGADELVVHEWGTFTTRHGGDGEPVVWQPLQVPSDLPRFVHRASSRATQKNTIAGTVRMETPVLYFYAPRRRSVSVTVRFPSGLLTEWYPRVRRTPDGIRWPRVTILPGATARLPREDAPSHYYPPRETDAALLRCRTQHERFLFYRGVGTFDVPVRMRLDGDLVHVSTVGPDALGRAVLVERRGDALGFRPVDLGFDAVVLERPTPTPDALAGLEETLRQMLVGAGLYAREAQAMLDTWRGTWSEEGTRLLYVVPGRLTDDVLPLAIVPAPSSLVRVLIGRAEGLAPEAAS